ncbi:hypothetical protein FT663_00103 [Candidozyma haemuli var. vulneris]|nr:hypothetical protein FT662_00269 [[Candida] haemuloni var. vulneris]KAF3995880.1 hypothetical protein FT663_00103 [[Candida] haemuloni var. vulneris]
MSGFFRSVVSTHQPKQPIRFSGSGASKTLGEIIKDSAPDFDNGSSFYVNPLLSSGHSQTAYTTLKKFEKVDMVYYKRRILNVESQEKFYYVNGDKMPYDRWEGKTTIAVDYVVPEGTDPEHEKYKPESQTRELPPRTEYLDPSKEQGLLDNDKPLVIALHGLSGGSYEAYIRAFMDKVTKEPYGFDGLVLNARGCANHTITSPQLFCGLWTNDLRYLINEHIRKIWPEKKIFLIGFSLGGAILANYLGQEGKDVYHNIKGAAVVGAPWDFQVASHTLVETYVGSKIYSPTMCQNLLRLLNMHSSAENLEFDEIVENYKKNPESFEGKLLVDFDNAFTSKMFGFNCASEYYRHASPDQRLLNVRVPTLIVSSHDDPVVGDKSLPYPEVSLNPYTFMVTTSVGGHLGWFNLQLNRWYPDPISQVFTELAKREPVVDGSILPRATDGIWKHDRIIQ